MKCVVVSDMEVNAHAGWLPVDDYAAKFSKHLGAPMYYPARTINRRLDRLAPAFITEGMKDDAPEGDVLLIIARNSAGLDIIRNIKNVRKKFKKIVAWVADSYFKEGYADSTAEFDCIAVTDECDATWVNKKFSVKTTTVRQGIDTGALIPALNQERSVDLIGFGRLPTAYHNAFRQHFHDINSEFLYLHSPIGNLTGPTVWQERTMLHKLLQRTKVSLAFHMHCNPEMDRPKSMMVTSRWLESLAAGCLIAGKRPLSAMADEMLFWPDATFELPDDPKDAIGTLEHLMSRPGHEHQQTRMRNVSNTILSHDIHDRMIELLHAFDMHVPASLQIAASTARSKASHYIW